jgi:flagellar motor switch protein FliG
VLAPVESEEIQEIATAIRKLSPVDADAAEPLIQLVA